MKKYWVAIAVAVPVILTGILVIELRHIPRIHHVRAAFQSDNKVILDNQGMIIDEVRSEEDVRRLGWVKLRYLPTNLATAMRAAHPSITFDLARLITAPKDEWELLNNVLLIKASWSQNDILEAYINLAMYRDKLQGIAAASYALLDKPPRKLVEPESALLAALTLTPEEPVTRAREAACEVLTQMDMAADCAALSLRQLNHVERSYQVRPFIHMAPQVADHIVELPSSKEKNLLRSTLDRSVQWVALHAIQRQMTDQGAAVVIENATGNVLAAVNVTPTAFTPAGSALKPLIYTTAIEERVLTTLSLPDDKPLRQAIDQNLNMSAVRALELVGSDTMLGTLTKLGLTRLQKFETYGPSLALGEVSVNLLELTNAYRTLPNGGVWSPIRFSPDETTLQSTRRIFSPPAAFIMADLMTGSRSARAMYWFAATAETNDERENGWSIGFSAKYTVGVWVNRGSAAPVWQVIMDYLHRQEPSLQPLPPEGLARAGRPAEWVILEKPIKRAARSTAQVRTRISYPKDRSRIDLPSEIRKEGQRLFFQVVAPRQDHNLYLNGRRLGRAQVLNPWDAETGRYTLELRDSWGQVVDKVRFEVRGRRFALAH